MKKFSNNSNFVIAEEKKEGIFFLKPPKVFKVFIFLSLRALLLSNVTIMKYFCRKNSAVLRTLLYIGITIITFLIFFIFGTFFIDDKLQVAHRVEITKESSDVFEKLTNPLFLKKWIRHSMDSLTNDTYFLDENKEMKTFFIHSGFDTDSLKMDIIEPSFFIAVLLYSSDFSVPLKIDFYFEETQTEKGENGTSIYCMVVLDPKENLFGKYEIFFKRTTVLNSMLIVGNVLETLFSEKATPNKE